MPRHLLAALCLALCAAAPPAQLLLAYYTGVAPDTVGAGHLNALALAFFDPTALSSPPSSCNFSDAATPCLAPAAGSGDKTLSWALAAVAATQAQLAANAAPDAQPLYLLSFGGATCGGAPWDAVLASPALAANFGTNAAALVAALAARVPGAAFGVDLDIEGTATPLPQLPALVAAYRARAAFAAHPLQLCVLSGCASPSSSDHFKLALLAAAGPAQGGISHVNLMVDNVDEPCAQYLQWWNASALAFLPPAARVGGAWGEIFPTFILHDPGCGALFPWMRAGGVGIGVWQWWTGDVSAIAAVIAEVKAAPAAAPPTAPAAAAAALAPQPPALPARALRADAVTLTPGSRLADLHGRNAAALLSLNLSDVLCVYTSASNLTGTFEHPACTQLEQVQYFGHFAGHYLSATAALANQSSAAARAAGAAAVATLAACQAAWAAAGGVYAGGYLFPYTYETWQGLFSGQSCAPTCVPFYVTHKLLAGLLDQATLAGNAQALAVALGVAAWVRDAAAGVLAAGGENAWQAVLGIEWGGINESFFSLFALTGDAQWRDLALLFEHYSWTRPLLAGIDVLDGNHANTHIPEVVGDVRGYEVTGNASKLAVAANFFSALNASHTYATGGSSDGEMWGPPARLGDAMNDRTEESCTTYNVIKLSRSAFFREPAAARHFDHFERALTNGLLGNIATSGEFAAGPAVGFIYMLPLGSSDNGAGLRKPWGASDQGLYCCWGTLTEVFAQLPAAIFAESADGRTLYVNLFASSTVSWAAQGATLTQVSGYPYAAQTTTQVTVVAPGASGRFALAVRVPAWAYSGRNTFALNGAALPAGAAAPAGSYFVIDRQWAAGDTLAVYLEQFLRFEQLEDDRPEWSGVGALMWGGTLLAAINATSDRLPLRDTSDAALAALFIRSPPPAGGGDYTDLVLSIRADGAGGVCGTRAFVPLADIAFQSYTVYQHTEPFRGRELVVNASGAATLAGAAAGDFVGAGGAAVVLDGDAALALRSGEPRTTSAATFNALIRTTARRPALRVTGAAFAYAYASGFAAGAAATNFSLVALAYDPCSDVAGAVLATVYASPPLGGFPYANCGRYTQQVPGGFLAAGDDVGGGLLTLQDAQANCTAIPACVAFTFAGDVPAPGVAVNVFLKSAVNFVAAPGWQTYLSSRVSEDLHDGHEPRTHAHHADHHRRTQRVSAKAPPLAALPAARAGEDACYSPLQHVSVDNLDIDASAGIQFALVFDNQDRNVRIALPANLTLTFA